MFSDFSQNRVAWFKACAMSFRPLVSITRASASSDNYHWTFTSTDQWQEGCESQEEGERPQTGAQKLQRGRNHNGESYTLYDQ